MSALKVAECRRRTLYRSLTYRVLAAMSSFLIVGIINGVMVEISKTVIFYLTERGWLYVNWQLVAGRETWLRIVSRALVYRLIATAWVAVLLGIDVAVVLSLIQTALFIANEIVWRKIPWGLEHQ